MTAFWFGLVIGLALGGIAMACVHSWFGSAEWYRQYTEWREE